jgi:hypothetical protein
VYVLSIVWYVACRVEEIRKYGVIWHDKLKKCSAVSRQTARSVANNGKYLPGSDGRVSFYSIIALLRNSALGSAGRIV